MRQYDVVRLIKDCNKVGIFKGQIGTLLEDHGDNHFEIEICDDNGITLYLGPISMDLLEVVIEFNFMDEKDLIEFLIFIAEEDAQISNIVEFFSNQLGYDVNALKNMVNYGVKIDILQVIKNDVGFENLIIEKEHELNEIDWTTSNVSCELYFKDFECYRNKLFVSNPKIPNEFRRFIKE